MINCSNPKNGVPGNERYRASDADYRGFRAKNSSDSRKIGPAAFLQRFIRESEFRVGPYCLLVSCVQQADGVGQALDALDDLLVGSEGVVQAHRVLA